MLILLTVVGDGGFSGLQGFPSSLVPMDCTDLECRLNPTTIQEHLWSSTKWVWNYINVPQNKNVVKGNSLTYSAKYFWIYYISESYAYLSIPAKSPKCSINTVT